MRRATRIAGESKARPLWLSVVVLEELYAGATDASTVRALAQMQRDFAKIKRLLVPNATDWAIAGRVLAKLGAKYGFEQIKLSRLTNDALIAMSADCYERSPSWHRYFDYQCGRLREDRGISRLPLGDSPTLAHPFQPTCSQWIVIHRRGWPARGEDYSQTGFRCVRDVAGSTGRR